jgi:hypothetical protein
MSAARHAIPVKRSTYTSLQIASSTRALIQRRNSLRSLWQRTHDLSLRPLINSLKLQIDSAIKYQLSDTWQKTLQSLDSSNMTDVWRITKRFTKDFPTTPPLAYNGAQAITVPEKLKAFADSLQQTFTPNPDSNKSFTALTEQQVKNFLKQPFTDRLRLTNHFEIGWLVRHLKPRSAPGSDAIQNILLQHLPLSALKFIATIYNKSLVLNYFPTQWKVAKIIMIPKPGKDLSSPLNYRPISLLNSLGKLFEKIILKRLNHQLRELKVIRDEQFGFKRGHSTTHALLRSVERITHGFNYRKATVTLFLDIERAFDKVWTTGLIAKLIQANISPHLIHILHSYLQHRSFFVTLSNSSSNLHPILAGVPQGSLLGPTLFNIFINDIPFIPSDSNVALSIYADDTSISVRSGSVDLAVRKLNTSLALLQPWLQKWRIKINTQKSTVTLFSRRRSHLRGSVSAVKLFNENIPWTKETKYLGVTLDSTLNFKSHISRILQKLNLRLRQLFPILNRSSAIDINLALTIYKSLLRSIMTYACPVWGFAAPSHIKKLQTFQNKVLRIITKLPRVTPTVTLHEQTGIPPISTHIKSLTTALYLKSATSTNIHIYDLGKYNTSADKFLRPLSIIAR